MASPSINAADLFSVKGLVAVITGGGTGIGLMIAQALAANGATVYIIGRRKEVLEQAASTDPNGNIIPLQGDVTSKPDLERIAATIKERTGYVNVVIANSGISGPTPGLKDLPSDASISQLQSFMWNWSDADFNRTYAINATGVFYTVVAFLELLDAGNKKGNVTQKSQVICTSSIAAYNRVLLAGYAYSSSKAAVTHMMKQFATNFVKWDIRSNVIAPGLYPSELSESMIKEKAGEPWPKEFIPAQGPGGIEDMAGVALFLVSRAGAYLNGSVLVTDGGRLSVIPSTY